MMYAIVTSDNDFSVSVIELYGTLWNFTFGEKFRNFMELFNVCYGTEQLWLQLHTVAPPLEAF